MLIIFAALLCTFVLRTNAGCVASDGVQYPATNPTIAAALDPPAFLTLGSSFTYTGTGDCFLGVRTPIATQTVTPYTVSIYDTTNTGTPVATATSSTPGTGAWVDVFFSSPVPITGTSFRTAFVMTQIAAPPANSYFYAFQDTPAPTFPYGPNACSVTITDSAYLYGNGYPSNPSAANYFVEPILGPCSSVTE